MITALTESLMTGKINSLPKVIGGRYGLSSKEFTPAMVKAVYDELAKPQPKNHFTVGIIDDVSFTSLDVDPTFSTEPADVVRAMFYGLGADGTVGANKNSIKIIGEETPNFAQGYFVYDSKKSGSLTTSHLRFGPRPIHSSYLITSANFVACHQWVFLEKYDILQNAVPGGTFLLNSVYGPDEVWDKLPRNVQEHIINKKLKFYVIDGYKVAEETGMGGRVNTIMQTCFFAISGVLPKDEAIEQIKHSIEKTYGKRGEAVVQKNFAAVDATLENLHEVKVPASVTSTIEMRRAVPVQAPEFVQDVTADHHRGPGRSTAGQQDADGRHVPHGHRAVGKAQHRAGNSGVGHRGLHSVRQVRHGLPALGDPRQGLRREVSGQRARDVQEHGRALEGIQGTEVHAAGRAGRLHGLHAVRGSVPGQEQEQHQLEGHQHGDAAAAARERSEELGFLPGTAGSRSDRPEHQHREGRAAAAADVRVQRRVLGLR